MELIIFSIITIITTILVVYLFSEFVKTYFNFKCLKDKDFQKNPLNLKHGMVYNKETDKLEPTESLILPF